MWKERRANSLETTYFFSLPIDYKYLEYSTDCQGSEPDFFFSTIFQSDWKHLFLIAFGFEN